MDAVYAFLWKLLENVLVAVLPILVTAITAWVVQKVREIGKTLNEKQMVAIQTAVNIAVSAAEQAGLAGLIDSKKQYALDLAQSFLNKQGIKVNVSLLEGIIEAAVKDAEFPHAP